MDRIGNVDFADSPRLSAVGRAFLGSRRCRSCCFCDNEDTLFTQMDTWIRFQKMSACERGLVEQISGFGITLTFDINCL